MCENERAVTDQSADFHSQRQVVGSVVSVPRTVGHIRRRNAAGRHKFSVMGSQTVSPRLSHTLPAHTTTATTSIYWLDVTTNEYKCIQMYYRSGTDRC